VVTIAVTRVGMEAEVGIEPAFTELQSGALPLYIKHLAPIVLIKGAISVWNWRLIRRYTVLYIRTLRHIRKNNIPKYFYFFRVDFILPHLHQ